MADLEINPALVVAVATRGRTSGLAGGAVAAGKVQCRDADGAWLPASAAAATSRGRRPSALGLNAAASGQPVALQRRGLIDLGSAVLNPGQVYYLSAAPGGLCAFEDLAEGDAIVAVGIAHSARLFDIRIAAISLGDGVTDLPPVNTVPPSILGVAQVGETLSVDLGEWDNAPDSYAVQWRLNGIAISGETDDEYLIDDADEGGLITVRVTATNAAGSTSATSAPTDPVFSADDPGFALLLETGDFLLLESGDNLLLE